MNPSNDESGAVFIVILLVAFFFVIGLIVGVTIASDTVESASLDQSCYVFVFTEVRVGDTWRSIANHWGMAVSVLKAMNKGVRLVEGAQVKVAALAGCPR